MFLFPISSKMLDPELYICEVCKKRCYFKDVCFGCEQIVCSKCTKTRCQVCNHRWCEDCQECPNVEDHISYGVDDDYDPYWV